MIRVYIAGQWSDAGLTRFPAFRSLSQSPHGRTDPQHGSHQHVDT